MALKLFLPRVRLPTAWRFLSAVIIFEPMGKPTERKVLEAIAGVQNDLVGVMKTVVALKQQLDRLYSQMADLSRSTGANFDI